MKESIREQNVQLQKKAKFLAHVIAQLRHKPEMREKANEFLREAAEYVPAWVDLISPQPGQVLVMRYPHPAGKLALERLAEPIADYLGCQVVLLPDECGLEKLDPAAMRAAGWVQESELVTD